MFERLRSATVVAVVLCPVLAHAHFEFTSFAEIENDQKTAPCGGGGSVDAGISGTFAPGDTVTINVKETIHHPGHYRVALVTGAKNTLPSAPAVSGNCSTAAIDATPTYPLLADSLAKHQGGANNETHTLTVQLPTDKTCENCTLQVIEVMTEKASGCFYFRCAAIRIRAPDAGMPVDAGSGGGAGGGGQSGTGGGESGSGGGSAATGGGSAATGGGAAATGGGEAETGGGAATGGGASAATGGSGSSGGLSEGGCATAPAFGGLSVLVFAVQALMRRRRS